jgi:hypothetical protein
MTRLQRKDSINNPIAHAAVTDILSLFGKFWGSYSLSFNSFKKIWKASNFSEIHECCPDRADQESFLQLLFECAISCMHSREAQAHIAVGTAARICDTTDDHQLAWISPLKRLKYGLSVETVVNIAVIYALYCLHGTQPSQPASQIRISPEAMLELR